jgi:hypothetical protein
MSESEKRFHRSQINGKHFSSLRVIPARSISISSYIKREGCTRLKENEKLENEIGRRKLNLEWSIIGSELGAEQNSSMLMRYAMQRIYVSHENLR